MPAFNNYGNTAWGGGYGAQNYNGYTAPVNTWGNTVTQPQPQMQQNQQPVDYREFVHGRAGAEAYQLKPGVTMQVLWDDETDRFYVKGYDNNGRPRVLADNDFIPHVEPEPQTPANIDLTPYATKEDIKQMIAEAFSTAQFPQPNLSLYVTQKEFNKALTGLSVGNGGRIVRTDEPNE